MDKNVDNLLIEKLRKNYRFTYICGVEGQKYMKYENKIGDMALCQYVTLCGNFVDTSVGVVVR